MGAATTCGKRVLQLVVAEIRRRRQSLFIFLVSLGELGGDVYVILLPWVYVVDVVHGLLGKLFIESRNIYVLGRSASGPVLVATTATTSSASTAWSRATAGVRAFDTAAITLIPDRLFLLESKCCQAWYFAKEIIVTHIWDMGVPVALGNFRWICRNLANRSSTTVGDSISRHVINNMVLSGLIAANDGRSGQG